MKNTACKSNREGRIISISSEHHNSSYKEGILFDKINDKNSYSAMSVYGQSALAKAIHTTELARRFKDEGVEIMANSLHPRVIATNIARHSTIIGVVFNGILKSMLKNIPQGAATTCYLTLNPKAKEIIRQYFADSNISKASKQATDPEMAKKLWDLNIKMTNSNY